MGILHWFKKDPNRAEKVAQNPLVNEDAGGSSLVRIHPYQFSSFDEMFEYAKMTANSVEPHGIIFGPAYFPDTGSVQRVVHGQEQDVTAGLYSKGTFAHPQNTSLDTEKNTPRYNPDSANEEITDNTLLIGHNPLLMSELVAKYGEKALINLSPDDEHNNPQMWKDYWDANEAVIGKYRECNEYLWERGIVPFEDIALSHTGINHAKEAKAKGEHDRLTKDQLAIFGVTNDEWDDIIMRHHDPESLRVFVEQVMPYYIEDSVARKGFGGARVDAPEADLFPQEVVKAMVDEYRDLTGDIHGMPHPLTLWEVLASSGTNLKRFEGTGASHALSSTMYLAPQRSGQENPTWILQETFDKDTVFEAGTVGPADTHDYLSLYDQAVAHIHSTNGLIELNDTNIAREINRRVMDRVGDNGNILMLATSAMGDFRNPAQNFRDGKYESIPPHPEADKRHFPSVSKFVKAVNTTLLPALKKRTTESWSNEIDDWALRKDQEFMAFLEEHHPDLALENIYAVMHYDPPNDPDETPNRLKKIFLKDLVIEGDKSESVVSLTIANIDPEENPIQLPSEVIDAIVMQAIQGSDSIHVPPEKLRAGLRQINWIGNITELGGPEQSAGHGEPDNQPSGDRDGDGDGTGDNPANPNTNPTATTGGRPADGTTAQADNIVEMTLSDEQAALIGDLTQDEKLEVFYEENPITTTDANVTFTTENESDDSTYEIEVEVIETNAAITLGAETADSGLTAISSALITETDVEYHIVDDDISEIPESGEVIYVAPDGITTSANEAYNLAEIDTTSPAQEPNNANIAVL